MVSDFALRVTEAIAVARRNAEALMNDSLVCMRPTGRTTRIDGKTVPELSEVWSGRGKVQSRQSYPSQPEFGGTTAAIAIFEVHVSARESFDFMLDDVFVVTESLDANLVGRRFRYRVDPGKTWRTARRFNCEEVAS